MTNFWLFIIASELNPTLIDNLLILGAVGATALWLFNLWIDRPAPAAPPPLSEEQLAERKAHREQWNQWGRFDHSLFRKWKS